MLRLWLRGSQVPGTPTRSTRSVRISSLRCVLSAGATGRASAGRAPHVVGQDGWNDASGSVGGSRDQASHAGILFLTAEGSPGRVVGCEHGRANRRTRELNQFEQAPKPVDSVDSATTSTELVQMLGTHLNQRNVTDVPLDHTATEPRSIPSQSTIHGNVCN